VLRAGEHRLTFTADNPFVLVDDRTVRLAHPVVSRSGELQIPVEVVRVLPTGGDWPRLAYDADAGQVRVAPEAGYVGAPRVEVRGAVTVLVVPTEHAEAVAVMGRSRARFRLRLAGGLAGSLPDSLPDDALVRDMAVSQSPGGLTFELALAPSAAGWRLERDPDAGRVTLSISARGGAGLEDFAAEGAPGPHVLHTVVLDPGHGGSDTGVRAEGVEEKALALELAHLLAGELARRGGVRCVLTRPDDRDVSQDARAEIANRAKADAVVSLHFETLPDERARGTLAWCPPAVGSAGGTAATRAAGLVALLPWRDVAVERAVESRGLAESITSSLEREGYGPSSVRERLPWPLVGVQPPGVLLECGVLSNPEERARLLAPGGLRPLAVAIADGLLAWRRNE
jgi:N-acetylmuramoyl-L-alanine amidase